MHVLTGRPVLMTMVLSTLFEHLVYVVVLAQVDQEGKQVESVLDTGFGG